MDRDQHVGAVGARVRGGGRQLALFPAHFGRVLGVEAGGRGHAQQHRRQERERRGLETQGRGIGGQRVQVLRSAHPAACFGRHVQEPHVAHALEVRSDGVHVQPEAVGDVGGAQRDRRAGQFEVDGVTRVVAQRLQDLEATRGLRRRRTGPD